MAKLFIYMSCALAMLCLVQSKTKTTVCSTKRAQLRNEVEISMNKLTSIGKKEMPRFYSKGVKCGGYIAKSPFPTKLLDSSLRNFVGPKFLQQTYKLFWPFMAANTAIMNGSSAVPSNAAEIQLWNVNAYVVQLVGCVYRKMPSVQKILTVKYNPTLHAMDVKNCLINAGEKATARKVQIVQYYEIFEELYHAVIGISNVASYLKLLKLK